MRRHRAVKRQLTPDVKYNSELVARLINTIMERGKKSVAQSIVYGAFEQIREKKKDMGAFGDLPPSGGRHAKPRLEVKSRRVGGGDLPGSCGGPA